MATYFHGNSEIQGSGDGLQTLILMNPTYVGFPENQPPQPPTSNNFVFLDSSNNINLPHAPPPSQIQHFVGIPLQGASATEAASSQDPYGQHDVSALHGFLSRNLYNQQIGLASARQVTRSHQGLSLSLSSQQPASHSSFRLEREVPTQPLMAVAQSREDNVRVSGGSPSSNSGVSNGVNGVQTVMFNSKYLKAAQELLDEVVKVQKVTKIVAELAEGAQRIGEPSGAAGSGGGGREESKKGGAELTTAERQEIQMKKAKLVNMLDEVEQRYRQYHHQMQIVISWFEQAAGVGSAQTYTALALQTISKQFRCLKDSILGQIRAATKSLGEEESFGGKTEGWKLKYVDNQIPQQRALQQLGMIQHNAWRPQRGLPERSVSVLRAWLFEHFLHPYPKDSDKLMLAKQTGLTRSQVSNWFINARVRLWKPMVEEMYLEETKEQEKTGSENKSQDEDSISKNTATQAKNPMFENQNSSRNESASVSTSTVFTSPSGLKNNSDFHLIGSSEMVNFTQKSPKKSRIPSTNMDSKRTILANEHMSLKFGIERQSRDEFTLIGAPTNFIGGFGSYPMGELGRFGDEQFQAPYSGNGVSLTLGLPHQNFMPNQSIQLERGGGDSNDFGGMIV
ncbi:BEL1-like homeodomain protein 1 [Primulina huaijiensis]|uniref:BEL1-like homeodomain protein 1 n=1 Tax=Primulina huaijiensis TaxID=1492673 RepID=UPI003CC791A0